jgi:hypothetical protein
MSSNIMVVVIGVNWVPVKEKVQNGTLILAEVFHQVSKLMMS